MEVIERTPRPFFRRRVYVLRSESTPQSSSPTGDSRSTSSPRDLLIRCEESPITQVNDRQHLLTESRIGVASRFEVIRASQKLELRMMPREAAARVQ